MPRSFFVATIAAAVFLVSACKDSDSPPFVDELGRCAEFDELRQVYWGDTHVHTDRSLDANMQGTRTTAADAYAFAKGRPVPLQPYDADGSPTRMAEIDRPLDFVMLSDHAEFLGTLAVCNDPGSPSYDTEQCVDYRAAQEFDADPADALRTFVQLNATLTFPPDQAAYPALCGPDGVVCQQAGIEVWAEIVADAEAAYDRSESCELTTFPGYEWSGVPLARNQHRNVMFKNANVTTIPYGYFDEPTPEGLWARLQEDCLDANDGCDVLTIPHNTNLSDGLEFSGLMSNGEPYTEDYVVQRNRMEPVIEIYQHKGASECLPGESSAPDELCGFEILPYANIAAQNQDNQAPPNPNSFLRYAYGEGMRYEEDLGTNPFEYAISAASDTHVSAPGFVAEDDFKGHAGSGQPNRFLPPPAGFPDQEYLSPGGLTGVWAEENAREAIFSAFKRKETFATSGPRIPIRLFGGWDYPSDLCDAEDLAARGYDGGVPMGGSLGPRPPNAGPTFVVSAKQDPSGAPLQRLQIVKGWLDGGQYEVMVIDVAGDASGGSVDPDTCVPEGSGASDLCAVWRDEDFDPSQRAYYYARAVENPTCRWSTLQCSQADYDCNEWSYADCVELTEQGLSSYLCDCCDPSAGLNTEWCTPIEPSCDDPESLSDEDARCCAARVETTIQERAWTSPIWYRPPG